jgi:L-fuconolactonase
MDLRVDSHQHFWRVSRGDYGWLRPDEPALAPLLRDFAPGDLRPLLSAHGVARTVLVQAADSVAETDFLLDLAARHDFIAGVVGWVDLASAGSIATLERWAAQPKFKGIRPMLQDLPDADWIAQRPNADVLRAIERLGLRFDALVKPRNLSALLRFVQRHPGLPVVIDHAAKPQLAQGWDAPWAEAWRAGMAALAAMPGLCCKFSGLLTEASPSSLGSIGAAVDALRPVWRALLDWFGAERLMWGSDWPVLTLAADYARWADVSDALIGELPAAQQALVRGGTAQRFYGLAAAA